VDSEIFGSGLIRPRLILETEVFYLCLDLARTVKYLAVVLLELDLFWKLKFFYLCLDLARTVTYLAVVLLDLDLF